MITWLPDGPAVVEPPPFAGEDHPMRKVTRQVAFDGAWDAERAAKVAALFDAMAAGWTADHDHPDRLAPLHDALARGRLQPACCLELGSGTGVGTRVLAAAGFAPIVALDLSFEMLRHAPAGAGARVHGDAATLPIADGTVDVVVLLNALLFPREVDRVLSRDGAVLWVNTMGAATPIHLPPEDVAAAMPGPWQGVAARAGTGTWALLRRA